MRYFFRGLLILVPLAVTVAVLYGILVKMDRWLGLPYPGAGLLILVAGTFLIGLLASNFVAKKVFETLERVFVKVPIVKLVYGSVRDLTGAFVGEKKSFEQPVLVALPGGASLVGFVTRRSLEAIGLPDHVAVYVPQAYAFAGHVLVFPRASVTPLAVDSAEVMAFLVSGGVSGLAAPKGAPPPPPEGPPAAPTSAP
jgi:uncharacterized membrane protein